MSNNLQELDYFLKIVLARKRLVLAVAMLVMIIGVGVAYLLPKTYEAQSTVFLEQNVITDLVKGIAITPSVDAKLKMLSVSLLSRTMLLKVINELNKDLALQGAQQLEDYLAAITKRIQISYQEKQGVFKITFRDSDPLFARDFVNTLTRKYIDENTSSKREESLDATKFLAEQIETFKRRIDTADEAINRYKSEKGYLLATDDVFLRGEIANAEKKLEELSIKRSELEAKKRIFTEQGPEPGKLSEAEARLAELLARYTEENPKVIKARAEVAALRAGRGDTSKRKSIDAIKNGIQMLQVEIDAYKEMEARQTKILEDAKNMLREIPNVKASLAELVRKKDNESVVYQQLVSRYGQSEVAKQMELQDKSITFRILDPAVTPLTPVSPNRLLIILGSVVAGLGAGVGMIILIDKIKGGIKNPAELKELGIPIFAVVPHVEDQAANAIRIKKDRIFVGFSAGFIILILLIALSNVIDMQRDSQKALSAIKTHVKTAVGN